MKTCRVCGDRAVAKDRCPTCYRYWLRSGRLRDRKPEDCESRYDRLVRAQEIRQLLFEAREGITLA